MNPQAIQMLRWAREATNQADLFSKGYVLGVFNSRKFMWEAWERQYVENVINRVFWEGKSA
jgi:hypothetical protein